MQRFIHLLYFFILTCASVRAADIPSGQPRRNTNTVPPDEATTWTGQMQRQLDSLVNLPLFETTQLGLYVYDLTDGRDLFSVNSRHRMRPASSLKVVTAVAALHLLGGDYSYKTRMLLTGEVRDSVLWGDICFAGGMDPLLSGGEVFRMVQSLHEAGIDSVAGTVYIDNSFKDSDDWGWGWCWDDDMVPLRPLLVDKKDCLASELPDDFCNAGIRGVTAERILPADCPADARLFCEVTHTIDEALQRMMKKSDNYYAESMFYQLATLSDCRPATRKASVAQINRLIHAIGLNPDDYQIADGSGVSLYTYVSPELLVGMLRHAWQDERIRRSLYPSLPVAGVDGTLEKRMRRTAARGNVHAKTGTVTGISSLTGYATSPEGHVLAFCIINQGVPKGSAGRDWQDKVCEVFCK